MSRTHLKRLIKILGYAFVVVSLGFLGNSLVQQFGEIKSIDLQASDILVTAGASILYGLALLFLALSWSVMLKDSEESLRRLASGIIVYSSTAILKYLPGNVFHFVGRNIGGQAMGKGHWRLASATAFEIVFSLIASLLLASFVFSFYQGPLPLWTARLLFLGLIVVGLPGVLFLPRIVRWVGPWLPEAVRELRLPSYLVAAFGCILLAYVLIMFAASMVALALLPADVGWQVASATFVLAWFIGFAVPGAPGGVGVREAAIVVGLSAYCSTADALLFAFVMRLVSTFADILLFGSGRILSIIHARQNPDTATTKPE